jgi:hypothetical protein
MSGSEYDPINFREVDPQGNPTGYGRMTPAGDARLGPSTAGLGRQEFGQPGFGQRSRRAVNPFIAALWVLVAILLVSPFGVFTLAQESLNSGTEPQVMPVSYMWITFAPQILFRRARRSPGPAFLARVAMATDASATERRKAVPAVVIPTQRERILKHPHLPGGDLTCHGAGRSSGAWNNGGRVGRAKVAQPELLGDLDIPEAGAESRAGRVQMPVQPVRQPG